MWLIVLGVLVLLAGISLIAAAAIHHSVLAVAKGKVYSLGENVPEREVALVLGARVYSNGRLSRVLQDRVDAAIELYKAGKVKKLLMSGDNREAHYNEVTAMRNYAISKGVASDDVVRDFAGFRTYDSVYRAKMLWDLDELIIVTQQFHLPRSLYIAEKLGVDAVGVRAKDINYRGLNFTKRREMAARIVAWLDVLIGRDPYFLGPKESLSGDSQVTRVKED